MAGRLAATVGRCEKMDLEKERFFKNVIFSLTLMGITQRGKVYNSQSHDSEKQAFRTSLREYLERITKVYENEVDEETHIQNIINLSRDLSSRYGKVLKNGRFRIGTSQKAINLYLKYLWCFGRITTPPHCPFDFQIISTLRLNRKINWTEMDKEEDYRYLVKAAKEQAQGELIAIWELQKYNNAQPAAQTDGQGV